MTVPPRFPGQLGTLGHDPDAPGDMVRIAGRAGPEIVGIGLMCVQALLFAAMQALAKDLGGHYPVTTIAWFRYTTPTLLVVLAFGTRSRLTLVKSRHWRLQIGRGALIAFSTLLNFQALTMLPLADAVAISFLSPAITTGLAVVLLRESVGIARWAAVAVGLAGVALIIRPGAAVAAWPALLAIGTAVCFSIYQILTRKLNEDEDEDPLTTLFYTTAVGAVLLGLTLPFGWKGPSAADAALMVALGLIAGVAHFVLIKAFTCAPASVLVPFDYTKLLWALTLGYLFFAEFPDTLALVGMAVVAASGLWVVAQEARRHQLGGEVDHIR